jgi:uncharacterized heparinase superfamily protein
VAKARPPRLWREAGEAVLDRAVESVLSRFRSSRLYRLTLTGAITDRIAVSPIDARPRSLDEASSYFQNQFSFAGHTVDAKDKSIWDCPLPSYGFAAELHGFEFLRHLEAASGEEARRLAFQLISDWLERYGTYRKPAWLPEIIATRLINLFCHSRFFLANSDLLWRGKFFVSLRDQTRLLARTVEWAPDGVPRLEATAALALAGLALSDARTATLGLKRLMREIRTQILPDGGHISRSPQNLLGALLVLDIVQQGLEAASREPGSAFQSALDRMASMVRFFRHGDGGLAVFNGGGESDPRLISGLLARDGVQGKPFGHAPHSGYQRLAAGRTTILMDAGKPPPGAYAAEAHAGCLAMEMSAGEHRIIVNCGAAVSDDENWSSALRATAAHSTLVVADTSSARILKPGRMRNLLGPRLMPAAGRAETRRSENVQGLIVEASHDLYLQRFGVIHERRLILSPRGTSLSGNDRILVRKPKTGKRRPVPFALRFHIHPDVRLSLAQGGGSVILKLPNGEGWRFRCGGGALTIEESVYLGGGLLRRAEQLVVAGHIKDDEVECVWLLEQVGAG